MIYEYYRHTYYKEVLEMHWALAVLATQPSAEPTNTLSYVVNLHWLIYHAL